MISKDNLCSIGEASNLKYYSDLQGRVFYYSIKDELYYKKMDKDKYIVYCPVCDEYETYSNRTFKQIRGARMCPKCGHIFRKLINYERCGLVSHINYVRFTKITPASSPITDNKFEYQFLYEFRSKWKFGQHLSEKKNNPINGTIRLVGVIYLDVYNGKFKKAIVRDIIVNGTSYFPYIKPQWEASGIWRETKSVLYYNYSIDESDLSEVYLLREPVSVRQHLEKFAYFLTKSNQIYIAKQNLLNEEQLRCLYMFDCKSADILYRYRGWIRDNRFKILNQNINRCRMFNEASLRYMVRNKIDFGEYLDYCDMCQRLDIKPSHPKDLQRQITVLRNRINEIRNKEAEEARKALDPFIREHSKELEKYSLIKDSYDLHPLRTIEECKESSKVLVNCLYLNYTKSYAKKRCELYVLNVNDVPKVNIEVTNGRLVQARGKRNSDIHGDLKKFVTRWAKEIRRIQV